MCVLYINMVYRTRSKKSMYRRRTLRRGGTGTNVTALMAMRRLAKEHGIHIPVEMEQNILQINRSPTRKNWRRLYTKIQRELQKQSTDQAYQNLMLRNSNAFKAATYHHPSARARGFYRQKYGLFIEPDDE